MAVCILVGVLARFPLKLGYADAHDLALMSLSSSTDQTYEGLDVRVEVVTRNQGTGPETFNVTLSANGTTEFITVDTYLVTSLGAASQIIIPFVWHTVGVTPGGYTLLANASVVEGELDIADNFLVGDDVTVMADATSPVIDVPVQDPRGDVEEWKIVHVYVNVSDAESGVDSVVLSWRVNNASSWESRAMEYDPLHGYSYAIGGYSGGTVVSYRVNATDNAGNHAVRDHAGNYYTYAVIPEFSSATVLVALLVFTLFAAWTQRRSNSPRT
jgi:hypothetical protein